jgi:Rrf2 family protein
VIVEPAVGGTVEPGDIVLRPLAWSGHAASRSTPYDLPLRVSARTDYAIRALIEMAASGEPITAPRISDAQAIPVKFLLNILADLRRAGLVRSQRGRSAGFVLAPLPAAVTLADIIRVIEGDLSRVNQMTPEQIAYPGAAEPLRDVWLAVRSSLSAVLGSVTLADVSQGTLPQAVQALAGRPYPPTDGSSAEQGELPETPAPPPHTHSDRSVRTRRAQPNRPCT